MYHAHQKIAVSFKWHDSAPHETWEWILLGDINIGGISVDVSDQIPARHSDCVYTAFSIRVQLRVWILLSVFVSVPVAQIDTAISKPLRAEVHKVLVDDRGIGLLGLVVDRWMDLSRRARVKRGISACSPHKRLPTWWLRFNQNSLAWHSFFKRFSWFCADSVTAPPIPLVACGSNP